MSIRCEEGEKVADAVAALEKGAEIAKSKNVNIKSLMFIGEGIQKLVKCEKEESKAVIARIQALSEAYEMKIDFSRYLTDNMHDTYIRIIGKKIKTEGDKSATLYYTDNGIYSSFYEKFLYKLGLHPIPISTHGVIFDENSKRSECTIFGPTCDSVDCMGNDFMLPEMEIGDWLKFENNGYKSCIFSARFNGFEDADIIEID